MAELGTRPGGRPADDRPLVLRQGWPAALAGTLLAAATAVMVIGTSTMLVWLIGRLAVVGVVVFLLGVGFGSERLTGLASLPMLIAAVVGIDPGQGLAWGRALAIGCLWYAALEAGWGSIEHRHGARAGAAIAKQRVREVATVVFTAVVVGIGGVALTAMAPTRTVAVRALMVTAVLVALTLALRHLQATAPDLDTTSEPELLDDQPSTEGGGQ